MVRNLTRITQVAPDFSWMVCAVTTCQNTEVIQESSVKVEQPLKLSRMYIELTYYLYLKLFNNTIQEKKPNLHLR